MVMSTVQDRLFALLEGTAGLQFKTAQWPSLELLLRALATERNESLLEALQALELNSNLAEIFAARCTVPETHFYRIKPQMEALRNRVLPELLKRSRGPRRFWSAGCSTGEEVYTLIVLMLEALGQSSTAFEVLGTDLSQTALDSAGAGRFGEWSFRDTPLEWRSQYFEPANAAGDAKAGWRVVDRVRRHATFQKLNLHQSTWPMGSPFDLIVCRNVTIYFSRASADRLYERLALNLAPGGWLLLGPSDPPPNPDLLERAQLSVVLEPNATLFRKWDAPVAPILTAPTTPARALPVAVLPIKRSMQIGISAEQALIDGLKALEREPQRALKLLRRAAYLEPQDAVIQLAKAQAFAALNESRRAWAALRQAERVLHGLSDETMLTLETRAGTLRAQLEALKAAVMLELQK
jgi:chemotaxis protein methyltransferase CheR